MIRIVRGRSRGLALVFCLSLAGLGAPVSDPAGFLFTSETLDYTVTWPSGLALGEAHMTAARSKSPEQWTFNLALDAAVPGFAVTDRYQATASLDLCSVTFERDFTHGSRKSHERLDLDQHEGVAHRETVGGGRSDVSISQCARDALTFLYFARQELGQGRVPPQGNILFGGAYHVRLDYTGAQTVRVNGKNFETDRVVATLKGPASEISFEMFFARDAARTPVVIRVPLSLGTFSMELAR